jgi:hypothetical protein
LASRLPPQAWQPQSSGVALQRGNEEPTRAFIIERSEPDVFLFAGTATREQIAATLFGDARLISRLMFVSTSMSKSVDGVIAQGVRPTAPEALTAGALSSLHAALEDAIAVDVQSTVSLLSERSIGESDESALVELCLRWSQRSDIPTPDGGNYFDAYLGALAVRRLSQAHWYTLALTETTRTALEWLIIETGEKSEQVKKAIELRSVAYKGTTGYTVTDVSPLLARGDVVGRFYYGSHDSTQIVIVALLGSALVEEAAVRLAQQAVVGAPSSDPLGIGVVVPAAHSAGFDAYSAELSLLPGVDSPVGEESGRFYGYHPGTRFVTSHLLWDQATRLQTLGDVRAQSGDWRADLVQMEALATQVRASAAGGVLPKDFVESWQAADRAMIAVSGRLAAGGSVESNRAAVTPVRSFFDRSRALVESFDVWQSTDPEGYGEPIELNPYFDPDTYAQAVQRIDAATSPTAWRRVLTDYHAVTQGMDTLWGAETRIRVLTRDSVPSADALPTLVGRPRACPPARPISHWRGDQGPGDPGPPATASRAPPPGSPPPVHPSGPCPARSGKPRASQAAVDVAVPGHAPDAAALAPRTRATQVDLPQPAPTWPATTRRRGHRTGAAHGQGEPALGLHADLRGAAQARPPGRRHDHPDAAATTRAGPGAAALRADLDAVPQSPGRGDRGVRLLHGGDDLAADPVRLVLHPAQHQAGGGPRRHGQA